MTHQTDQDTDREQYAGVICGGGGVLGMSESTRPLTKDEIKDICPWKAGREKRRIPKRPLSMVDVNLLHEYVCSSNIGAYTNTTRLPFDS